jgi:hypothetical protein
VDRLFDLLGHEGHDGAHLLSNFALPVGVLRALVEQVVVGGQHFFELLEKHWLRAVLAPAVDIHRDRWLIRCDLKLQDRDLLVQLLAVVENPVHLLVLLQVYKCLLHVCELFWLHILRHLVPRLLGFTQLVDWCTVLEVGVQVVCTELVDSLLDEFFVQGLGPGGSN